MGKKIILFGALIGFLFLPLSVKAADDREKGGVSEPSQNQLAVDTDGKASSGLPIPRFVSLSKDEVVERTGPGLRYPMKRIYKRKGLPVEIIQEFDTWRKVRDMDGDDGWVHQSLLSGKRGVIVKGEAGLALLALHKSADENSNIIANLETGVLGVTEKCKGEWCRLSSGGYDGWVKRKFLWGIYDSEEFD